MFIELAGNGGARLGWTISAARNGDDFFLSYARAVPTYLPALLHVYPQKYSTP